MPENESPALAHPSFEKRLTQYGAMSLAIAGAAFAPQAQGSTVFWSGHGQVDPYFNFFTGAVNHTGGPGTGGFALARTSLSGNIPSNVFGPGAALRLGGSTARSKGKGAVGVGSSQFFDRASKLRLGAKVGPSKSFQQPNSSFFGHEVLAANRTVFSTTSRFRIHSHHVMSGNFQPVPQTGYIGLEFGGVGGEYYGWANVTVNADYTVTLNEFAYNNVANEAIVISAPVPEPASILLMALGAAGLAAYRRKRTAQIAKSTSPSVSGTR